MVFSSLIFLYAFLPLSLLAYVLCPGKNAKNVCLLIFSLVFYAWGEPKYVLLLMFMALCSWLCALGVDKAQSRGKQRLFVGLAAVIDIALIGYFKYSGLIFSIFGPVPEFISRIALPIGISFYTFQLLTYVVDVYRGEAPAQKSYWNVLLYAALFHQCIAGPIVRYRSIDRELFSGEARTPELKEGVSRFAAGLAKKVMLANPCGAIADSLILAESAISDAGLFSANFQALANLPVAGAWAGVLAYSLQLYLDFSAYSDMAIGMGKMIGLHYPENFNYPYISRSVTEFWRRWHISLGSFFRDYVYIPLGGNRCSKLRWIFNIFAVWSLTGLWHGADWNYLLWGLWAFLFLMIERAFLMKILNKLPVISNIYLIVVVMLGRVLFRFTDLELGWTLVRSMFGATGNALINFSVETILKSNVFILAVSIFACTPAMKLLKGRLEAMAGKSAFFAKLWNIGFYALLPVALLLVSTAALVGDSYNPFLYFQF